MKIALVGYGKMGKAIEQLAIDRGHVISHKFTSQNPITKEKLKDIDVAIDFSLPNVAFDNISTLLNEGIAVVSGTTGWLQQLNEVRNIALNKQTAFIHATNFSVGVNLFFELNKKLAELMKNQNDYFCSIEETHHTTKIDAPSGTAITLNEQLNQLIEIQSFRKTDAIGTHNVKYTSNTDSIEITHEAKNRKGFASGAVLAAEWIIDKKGCFSMKDVLNLK